MSELRYEDLNALRQERDEILRMFDDGQMDEDQATARLLIVTLVLRQARLNDGQLDGKYRQTL